MRKRNVVRDVVRSVNRDTVKHVLQYVSPRLLAQSLARSTVHRPAKHVLRLSKTLRDVRRYVDVDRRASYVARQLIKPDRYVKHSCRSEYKRLLSWRASRGNGSRRRDYRNDYINFRRRDC